MNPKCQTRPGFDIFSVKSADLTGLKMRRITRGGSFDHLVGEGDEYWRHGEAQPLCGLEVDYKLQLGGLQDRQIGGPFTPENPSHIKASFYKIVGEICPTTH